MKGLETCLFASGLGKVMTRVIKNGAKQVRDAEMAGHGWSLNLGDETASRS